MVEAYAERPVWSVIPGGPPPDGDEPMGLRPGQLRLLPAPDATPRPGGPATGEDPFERAGMRVGRAIGRLGLRFQAPAATPLSQLTPVRRPAEVAAPGNVVALRGAPGPSPNATLPVEWRQVKQALDVVDVLPPLRAVADTLLGPWGLDLLVVGAAVVGLLYPGNPLGIAVGHADLLDLALPVLKATLGVVLSPLAVEVALVLLGIGRLLWSRRATSPRAALSV